ncbi:hypothetical protein [Desulfovibrio sp.]|uniref:hypothetical protein n=1 Tax=Desulfovibrio sp. TaxID=885 RepID=UPI0025B80D6E|nr:hypothetical protein [Desulfovibrio sp.]
MPETVLGYLHYSDNVTAKKSAQLAYYADNVEGPIIQQLVKTELADMPNIHEGRSAYKAFGANPDRYRILQKDCIAGCGIAFGCTSSYPFLFSYSHAGL